MVNGNMGMFSGFLERHQTQFRGEKILAFLSPAVADSVEISSATVPDFTNSEMKKNYDFFPDFKVQFKSAVADCRRQKS
uniref:Uncharacterized protein n=1 Tax=Romanomermis culicivorax TaxID=13658 RepID=A0A915L818_ROMCU